MNGESDQTKGRVKEAYGVLSGDEELQSEGKHDQLAGKAKSKAEHTEKKIEQGIDKLKDTAETALEEAKEAGRRT